MRTLRYGSDAAQQGDLYLPAAAQAPVVCLLHGGFWRMPYGRDEFAAVAADLVARGYAVWNIEYRRVGAPGGGWPGTLHDAAAALEHLAALVDEGVALDLDRVVVAGHSAGGQLALWLGAQLRAPMFDTLRRVRPVAVAAMAAVSNLAQAHALDSGGGAVAHFLGDVPAQVPERYAAASPRQRLPLGVRQLVLHGSRDEALPVAMAREYAAAACAAGDAVEFVELPQAGHMDYLDPASEAHRVFCDWLERTA
jgi:acetyl esterase/lipase